ncbi:MAG: HAMP domain-containing histidine kinase [Clostridiaceae bacterium]|nr:HAMP domain-containing histidine kinase [Clostridiaceae bacterium]
MESNIHDENMYTFIQKQDENLRDKFKYYEQLHLNKGRGFAVYNVPNLVLLIANNEYENYLNNQYGFKEFHLGKTFYEISTNSLINSRLPFFKKVIKTGDILSVSLFKYETVLHKEIILEVTYIPIYEKDEIKYIIESFSDVTERENQKTQLILFEKQKEFFFFICHEFKMPLTVILSAVQMFKVTCKDELSPSCLKYIKKIKQGSFLQLRLVNNLLDILKSDSGNIKIHKKNLDIVEVTTAIIDTVSVYAITKGVKIKFSSSITELIIGIDDEKYERILLNLLSNAIKFTPRGKNIQVKIDIEGSNVRIEVKDSGVGISIDKLGVIFELFGQSDNSLTRENEGTGIGLYLVKQLIDALDGKIKVNSIIGKGSSFVLLLPIAKIKEDTTDFSSHVIKDNHLTESTDIEFSSIYFD